MPLIGEYYTLPLKAKCSKQSGLLDQLAYNHHLQNQFTSLSSPYLQLLIAALSSNSLHSHFVSILPPSSANKISELASPISMHHAYVLPYASDVKSSSKPVNLNSTCTSLPSSRETRKTRKTHQDSNTFQQLSIALKAWHTRTNSPTDMLPADSMTRRCDVAKELHLAGLIHKAGGYRRVQKVLKLRPPTSSTQIFCTRELEQMTAALQSMCQKHRLAPPDQRFPSRDQIRLLSPSLANRIAAFPGRKGYGRLIEYLGSDNGFAPEPHWTPHSTTKPIRSWGIWTSPDTVFHSMARYQRHPHVLPRLCSLPTSIANAIQRQGGATLFARQNHLVLEREWANILRFTTLVKWLSNVCETPNAAYLPYLERVRQQAQTPPKFPCTKHLEACSIEVNIHRYGGRRALALRFGLASEHAIKGLRMAPFSIQFAADLLEFASHKVLVSDDGSIAMPSASYARAAGRSELAEAIVLFGGEDEVGRRVGLVHMEDTI